MAASDEGSLRKPTRVGYFVSPSNFFAGIERVVHEVAAGLAEAHAGEFEVHVLSCSDYDEQELAATPYTRHVLGADRLRSVVAALRRAVSELDLDVLVVPQVEASVTAWIATRGLRLPALVTHLHGNPRVELTEGTRRTRAAFGVFRRIVAPRLAVVLAVSPSLRDYAHSELVDGTPVRFVRNPVRVLENGPQRPAAVPGSALRLLTVGRLSRQKGQDVLLRALATARDLLPAVTLTIVGTGPEEQRLRSLCTELAIDDFVRFAGHASDPAPYFAESDGFVLASRWEGFGVVLVEALQFGLPVLATDCEFGPRDVVVDERIGLLVPPDDVDGLAAGLVRFCAYLSRPSGGAKDGEGARRAHAERYTRREAVGDHVDVLRGITRTEAR